MVKKIKLSPSHFYRQLYCTASIPYSTDFVESEALVLGKFLHKIAETFIEKNRNNKEKEYTISQIYTWVLNERIKKSEEKTWKQKLREFKIKITEKHFEWVEQYVYFIRKMFKDFYDSDFYYEQEKFIDFQFFGIDMKSALDLVAYDEKTMLIIDFKTGKGRVEVKDNDQLYAYAFATYMSLKKQKKKTPDVFVIGVCQPAISNNAIITLVPKDIFNWWKKHKEIMETEVLPFLKEVEEIQNKINKQIIINQVEEEKIYLNKLEKIGENYLKYRPAENRCYFCPKIECPFKIVKEKKVSDKFSF